MSVTGGTAPRVVPVGSRTSGWLDPLPIEAAAPSRAHSPAGHPPKSAGPRSASAAGLTDWRKHVETSSTWWVHPTCFAKREAALTRVCPGQGRFVLSTCVAAQLRHHGSVGTREGKELSKIFGSQLRLGTGAGSIGRRPPGFSLRTRGVLRDLMPGVHANCAINVVGLGLGWRRGFAPNIRRLSSRRGRAACSAPSQRAGRVTTPPATHSTEPAPPGIII